MQLCIQRSILWEKKCGVPETFVSAKYTYFNEWDTKVTMNVRKFKARVQQRNERSRIIKKKGNIIWWKLNDEY